MGLSAEVGAEVKTAPLADSMPNGKEASGSTLMSGKDKPQWRFQPHLEWNPQVEAYLRQAYGEQHFSRMCEALSQPPSYVCLRVNTLLTTVPDVISRMAQLLQLQKDKLSAPANGIQAANEGDQEPICFEHPGLPGVVMVRGSGPHEVDYSNGGDCELKEVLVSRKCAEAVLRGAQVFVPGVFACNPNLEAGDLVGVSVAVEKPDGLGGWAAPCTRGALLGSHHAEAQLGAIDRSRWFIGKGRAAMARTAIFREANGVAVEMVERVYDLPPCHGLFPGEVFLQNLPSVVAARVLDPQPGERILDMCAAPGGKTTAIAILMGDHGEVVALDRSHNKVKAIAELAAEMGLTCIQAHKLNSLKAALPLPGGTASATDDKNSTASRLPSLPTPESPSEGTPGRWPGNQSEGATRAPGADGSPERLVGGAPPQDAVQAMAETEVGGRLEASRVSPRETDGIFSTGAEGSESALRCLSPAEPCSVPSRPAAESSPTSVSRSPPASATSAELPAPAAVRAATSAPAPASTSSCARFVAPAATRRQVEAEVEVEVGAAADRSAGEPRAAPSDREKSKQTGLYPSDRAERKAKRRLRNGPRSLEDETGSPRIKGFPPASFDRVLLDAPCSALGLRPRLFAGEATLEELRKHAVYQRRLMDQAVQLVRPGGVLVYSTCTINPGENEALVRYALDKYSLLTLAPQEPRLGGPGLVGGGDVFDGGGFREWLREGEQDLVQRFDPCGPHDSIGFFISKFNVSEHHVSPATTKEMESDLSDSTGL